MNDLTTLPMNTKEVKTDTISEFEKNIARCTLKISYIPCNDEPDPLLCPYIPNISNIEYIQKDISPTPIDRIHALLKKYDQTIFACILIPGRAFDTTGTRHGRGGGWYDRFLSQVPKHWIRIGITPEHRFHTEKLFRKSHDEPMDFIIVSGNKNWDIYKTDARSL